MTRPRDRAHHHAVTATAHPRRLGLHVGQRRPEVQRPPTTPARALIGSRRSTPTDAAAITLAPARADPHHEPVPVGEDVLDDRPAQPKQPRPYPDAAHVDSALLDSDPEEAGTLGTERRAHPYPHVHLPPGNSRSPRMGPAASRRGGAGSPARDAPPATPRA